MMIRTESDVSRAWCYSTDLAKLVSNYFKLWRKHCQGINNVVIPDRFWAQVLGFKDENTLRVRIISFETLRTPREIQRPVYDLGGGPIGSDLSGDPENVWYYETDTVFDREEFFQGSEFTLPVAAILVNELSDMEANIVALRQKHDATVAEEKRQSEIRDLEGRLKTLKGE
jgi:hypothetical protein